MVVIQWRGQSEEDDLDLGDPSLVVTTKGLIVMMPNKDAHSVEVLIYKGFYKNVNQDCKAAHSNEESKDSIEKSLNKYKKKKKKNEFVD